MAAVLGLSQVTIQNGLFLIPVTVLPPNSNFISVSLSRNTLATPANWSLSGTTADVAVLVSTDGGLTFKKVGGFTSGGGSINHRGVNQTKTSVTFSGGVNPTHIQGTITVANGPLVTDVTIDSFQNLNNVVQVTP